MNSESNLIDNILSKFNESDTLLAKKNAYESFHIFNNLKENFGSFLTASDSLNLYYNVNLFESCLGFLRKKELFTAVAVFANINIQDDSFPAIMRPGMMSLYNAMASYKDYVFADFEGALLKLDLAIKYTEEQGLTYPFFLTTIGEQWLNKMRVYIRLKDEQLFLSESVNLYKFLLGGEYHNEAVAEIYNTLDENIHHQVLNHVLNSVDLALRRTYNDDHKTLLRYYNGLAQDILLLDKCLDEDILICFRMILTFGNNNRTQFLDEVNLNFESVQKAPNSLQRVISEHLITIINDCAFPIHDHPCFEYFKNDLLNTLNIKIAS
jgi:hypothetical protein